MKVLSVIASMAAAAGASAIVLHKHKKQPVTTMGNGSCVRASVIKDSTDKFPTEYRGMKDTTANGRKCMRWVDKEGDLGKKFADDFNYCRSDANSEMPYCFSVDQPDTKADCAVPVCSMDGPFARDFNNEADVLASDVDATDCQCADQLYGSTTTTKDTSVAGTSLAAKKVKMGKFNAKTQKCSC